MVLSSRWYSELDPQFAFAFRELKTNQNIFQRDVNTTTSWYRNGCNLSRKDFGSVYFFMIVGRMHGTRIPSWTELHQNNDINTKVHNLWPIILLAKEPKSLLFAKG